MYTYDIRQQALSSPTCCGGSTWQSVSSRVGWESMHKAPSLKQRLELCSVEPGVLRWSWWCRWWCLSSTFETVNMGSFKAHYLSALWFEWKNHIYADLQMARCKTTTPWKAREEELGDFNHNPGGKMQLKAHQARPHRHHHPHRRHRQHRHYHHHRQALQAMHPQTM